MVAQVAGWRVAFSSVRAISSVCVCVCSTFGVTRFLLECMTRTNLEVYHDVAEQLLESRARC